MVVTLYYIWVPSTPALLLLYNYGRKKKDKTLVWTTLVLRSLGRSASCAMDWKRAGSRGGKRDDGGGEDSQR